MKVTIVLDEKAERELEELSRISKASRSEVVMTAVEGLYLKEKRAREDAEAIIIGSATGKWAAEFAKAADY